VIISISAIVNERGAGKYASEESIQVARRTAFGVLLLLLCDMSVIALRRRQPSGRPSARTFPLLADSNEDRVHWIGAQGKKINSLC
jgi:hypothetical protein